jgi:O-antigen/teichoic acid export membrane protein
MSRVEGNSPMIRKYLWMAFPMALFYVLSSVLAVYSSNFKRIVVPSILLDFSQKLALPLLMLGVWWQWFELETALWAMMAHSFLVFLSMVIYLRWLGEWHWKPNWQFISQDLRKELGAFIGFWAIGGFALLLAAKMDVFMVGSLSAVKAAGSFSIAVALAAIIELPIKSLYAASASFVAKHLSENNLVELEKLYKSVSVNLLVAGLLLFGGLWISIESIFHFFPENQLGEIAAGKWAFFFIGLARIAEMSTGLNNNVVYYSPYYRFSLFSLSIASILTIVLNLVLIPKWGMVGAAIATLCSVSFYNGFSVWLVWLKFRLFPFTVNTLYAIIFAILAYFLAHFVPYSGIDLLDIVLRGGVFALLFGLAIFSMKISPELNDLWAVIRKKINK